MHNQVINITRPNNTTDTQDGVSNTTVTALMTVTPQMNIDLTGLTMLQTERFQYLKRLIHPATAFSLVKDWMQEQGINSYKKICDRIRNLRRASEEEKPYIADLNGRFQIGKTYNMSELIDLVFDARESAGLEMFSSTIFESCINELSKCFVFEVQTISGTGKNALKQVTIHASLI